MVESLKNLLRTTEARLTPRTLEVAFAGHTLKFQRSLWWVNETQHFFDQEIVPYFAPVQRNPEEIRTIIDAGAATGLFAVAASKKYPRAAFHCFEPSPRQRILLGRNLKRNGLGPERAEIFHYGLWDRETDLAFRTIGAMSAIEEVSHLAGQLSFTERVPVIPLDVWCERRRPERIDLIKMDIEGAEIEALRGAVRVLERHRPELLVMAYHEREGTRAYERCAEFLEQRGYACREVAGVAGFLHGVPR